MKRAYSNEEEFRAAVLRARAMTAEEKFAETCRLTELMFEEMRVAVRLEFPEASEEDVQNLLIARVDEERRREDEGFYIKVPLKQ